MITSLSVGVQSVVNSVSEWLSVCLFVCLFVRSYISKTVQISPNFLYISPLAVDRSSSDDGAIRYLLPVLCIRRSMCFVCRTPVTAAMKYWDTCRCFLMRISPSSRKRSGWLRWAPPMKTSPNLPRFTSISLCSHFTLSFVNFVTSKSVSTACYLNAVYGNV